MIIVGKFSGSTKGYPSQSNKDLAFSLEPAIRCTNQQVWHHLAPIAFEQLEVQLACWLGDLVVGTIPC